MLTFTSTSWSTVENLAPSYETEISHSRDILPRTHGETLKSWLCFFQKALIFGSENILQMIWTACTLENMIKIQNDPDLAEEIVLKQ